MAIRASQVVLVVKNLPVNSGDIRDAGSRSLGQKDLLGEGMVTHSSTLAWKIPWTDKACWATVYRVAKSWTQLKRKVHTHSGHNINKQKHTWRKKKITSGTDVCSSETRTSSKKFNEIFGSHQKRAKPWKVWSLSLDGVVWGGAGQDQLLLLIISWCNLV